MSVLIEVSKSFESTTSDGQHQSLVAEAATMLTAREGVLNALKENFERNELGHIISTWIGKLAIVAILSDQVESVLGNNCVANLATKAGISPETTTEYLTKSLPHLADALTPNGKIGGANDLLSRGNEILAAFASKKEGV
jgi:uncharacterized protein YidB (DUF937 family)